MSEKDEDPNGHKARTVIFYLCIVGIIYVAIALHMIFGGN